MVRLLALLVVLFMSAAPAHADECYSLGSGGAANITGPDGVCRQVINYNGAELCVTTYNVSEWQNFYNAGQGGVSIGSCPALTCNLPWGGTINNGDSVTAYASSSGSECSSGCASETRTCSNGYLSGSYGNSSCTYYTCASGASGGLGHCYAGYCYVKDESQPSQYGAGSSNCNDICSYVGGGCDLAGTQYLDYYTTNSSATCDYVIRNIIGFTGTPHNGASGPSIGGFHIAMGCFEYDYDNSWPYDGPQYDYNGWPDWWASTCSEYDAWSTCEANPPYYDGNWFGRICACDVYW